MPETPFTLKPAPRPGVVQDNLLPLAAIFVSLIGLTLGWQLFSGRLVSRTARADAQGEELARIWGGPLLQPHPEVRWRRADAATAELAPGELASSKVKVDLDVTYKRKGITEYPCYTAGFGGDYEFKNPSGEPAFVAFAAGMPAKRDALMLTDIKLLVDGQEDPANTEYTPERVVWTGKLPGGKAATFRLAYRARGLDRFGYTLGNRAGGQEVRPITAFTLAMNVSGARGLLDRPSGWMSPTGVEPLPNGGESLVWNVDRLLSSFDLGVALPDNRSLSTALAHLIDHAPVFYLLFGGALLYALAGVKRKARTLHVLGLSGAYFLYFPLATYLTAYLPWPAACGVALLGIAGLSVLHAYRFVGGRAAVGVALSVAFFLAVPAGAYLVPAHTGLTLVVAGFLALGVGLQVVGALAKRVREDDEPLLPAVVARPAPAAPVVPAPAPGAAS